MAENSDLLQQTADIVAAHVANNAVAVGDMPTLIELVHGALKAIERDSMASVQQAREPFVSVKASLRPDHLVCLECGSKQKMLKRHIRTSHGLSPDEYRKAYNLSDTYPLVAPKYAQQRSELARSLGLGTVGQAGRRQAARR